MTDSVLKPKNWRLHQPDPVREAEFLSSLPVSPPICRILVNRGICGVEEARRFLSPEWEHLHDPLEMDGMDLAVSRVLKALDANEKIMIHGDYDVDGITAAALLIRVLRILQADVTWHIPHRRRDGYDIGMEAVEKARELGVSLIVTVDCGTSAAEAVSRANSLGIDVVVTDHHVLSGDLAPALAVVNPQKPGCPYPFKGLAGVGVAFKFAEALVWERGYDTQAFRRRFCDLAAVGTVADVVPLIGENRVLVKFGLEELPRSGKKGLTALLNTVCSSGRSITSQTLAYGIGPRLNAAGRLDDASISLELLLTADEARAAQLAHELEMHNRQRQTEQERMTQEALEQIIAGELDKSSKVLVLSSEGWHPGIVGIVAGKITDRYARPAILVAVDEAGKAGVGSARSIAAFDILGALTQCGHLLERCGGHSRAAGLSIDMQRFGEFSSAINGIADGILTESDLVPSLEVDAEIPLESVTHDLASELSLLEPTGFGNHVPVFISRNVMIADKTRMGSDGAHMRLKLASTSGANIECVAFGWGLQESAFSIGSLMDVCYNIQINHYGGNVRVQTVLKDARHSEAAICDPIPSRYA